MVSDFAEGSLPPHEASASLASQVRRAMVEQAGAAAEITRAVDGVRRGIMTPSRALEEQTAAGDLLTRETERLRRLATSTTTAMAEQATGMGQIAQAAEDMRRQGDQTSRGLAEQSRAASDIGVATNNVARQVAMIVRANREQSENGTTMLATLAELRRIGDRATQEVRDSGLAPVLAERTRSTAAASLGTPPSSPATRR